MSIEQVKLCGSVGVIKDLPGHELPIHAWTDCKNVRFLDGSAMQFYGHGPTHGTPAVVPYHLVPCQTGSTVYWMYAGLAKIYAVAISGGVATHTNITRQTAGADVDYTGGFNTWTSTIVGGIPVLNNGVDYPQQWGMDIAARCTNLSNWPANLYCASIRAYKGFLFALNITKTTTNYPHMIKWSSAAVPGSVPSTWDETDAAEDAGERDLAEDYGHIVDGRQLAGQHLMVHKTGSIWRVTYIGGQQIFESKMAVSQAGALNRNCIVDIGKNHCIMTGDDIILCDGFDAVSVLNKQTRRWLQQNMDIDGIGKAFVFLNPFFNEVFFCFATLGSTYPDMAMVWNHADKTISFRDIPNLTHAVHGKVNSSLVDVWSGDSAPWNSDQTTWGQDGNSPANARVMMSTTGQKIYMLDSAADFDGSIPSTYLERRGLTFGSENTKKVITFIRPRFEGNAGEVVTVSVGVADNPKDDPVYTNMSFTIGTDRELQPLVEGRFIAFKFASTASYSWKLTDFDVGYEFAGQY